jgi:phage baseplate assembly protein W
MINVAFPYHLDDRGRTATAVNGGHIEQMLEQLLFTRPGERVNRPDFGCGLLDMVFAPNSPEVAAAMNVTITAAIGRWLGDVISLSSIDVSARDSVLQVTVAYVVIATGVAGNLTIAAPGGM